MPNPNEPNVPNVPNEPTEPNQNYIEAIKKLKAESVSRKDFETLQEENKKLVDALVNGDFQTGGSEEEKPETAELRKKLSTCKSDIEFVETALQLRENVLEEEQYDIFAGNNNPSQGARESAEATAELLKSCLDYAEGDNAVFINELQRHVRDVQIQKRR